MPVFRATCIFIKEYFCLSAEETDPVLNVKIYYRPKISFEVLIYSSE